MEQHCKNCLSNTKKKLRFFPSLVVVILCFLVPVSSALAQIDNTDDPKV